MKNVPVTVLKILSEFPPQIFILLLGLLHCSNDTNIYFHAPIVSLFRSSFMVHHPSLLFLVQIFVQIKRQSITGNLFGRGNPISCRDLYWSVWSFCEIRGRPNRKLVLMWFSASIQVLHSVQLHHSFCSVMLCPTSFSRSIWVTNACALKRMNGFETRKTSLTEPFSKIFLFARLSVRVRLCLE